MGRKTRGKSWGEEKNCYNGVGVKESKRVNTGPPKNQSFLGQKTLLGGRVWEEELMGEGKVKNND